MPEPPWDNLRDPPRPAAPLTPLPMVWCSERRSLKFASNRMSLKPSVAGPCKLQIHPYTFMRTTPAPGLSMQACKQGDGEHMMPGNTRLLPACTPSVALTSFPDCVHSRAYLRALHAWAGMPEGGQ